MKETKIKKTRAKKPVTSTCANCPLNLTLKEHVIEGCISTIQNIMNDTGKTVVCGDISEWEKFKLAIINHKYN